MMADPAHITFAGDDAESERQHLLGRCNLVFVPGNHLPVVGMNDALQYTGILDKLSRAVTGDALYGRGNILVDAVAIDPVLPVVVVVGDGAVLLFARLQRFLHLLVVAEIGEGEHAAYNLPPASVVDFAGG